MKERTNVFTIPNWMKNLCVRKPHGTYTPDQVTAVLEMNLLFNGDVPSLRSSISTLIPLVPLKNQKMLKAFLDADDSDIIGVVQAFINEVNIKLAPLLQEQKQELIQVEQAVPVVYEDDWDRPTGRKPSSRESRALRNAKRQSEA